MGRYRSRIEATALRRAGRLGSLARIDHVGRRSGLARHTPVRAFRSGNLVAVGVNFGVGSQWVQNVLAAGSCRMILRGRELHLEQCRLVPLAEAKPLFPWWFATGLRWVVRTDHCLVLRVRDERPSADPKEEYERT